MNSAKKIVGIDVGKEKLDVCYPDGKKETIRNIKSCRTKVIKKAAQLGAFIAFEATGPYEESLAEECLARGVKAVRLDKNIAKVEAECDAAIASDERLKELDRRFREVKGVGPCLSCTVLVQCPDIGDFNSKSIAKMCGNAPLDHESCTIKGKAKPHRDRSDLKKALYMAAVSASRNNHILREFYQRLVANGKARKVALTAVARRIAVLLNTIAKHPDFAPEKDPI